MNLINRSLRGVQAFNGRVMERGGGGGGAPTPLHLPPPPGRGKQNNPGLNRVKLKCTECMKNVLHRFQDAPTAKYTPDGRS